MGDGTTFTLSLPVTLAILPALLVRVRGEALAVPLGAVTETLLAPREAPLLGFLELRGKRIPCAELATHLGFAAAPPNPLPLRPALVVKGGAERWTALCVDELIGQQDVVVKPLGGLLGDVPGVAGVAELGGGELVLVLDGTSLGREVHA